MARAARTRRKVIVIDEQVAAASEALARCRGISFAAIAEQAIRAYLKKEGQPLTLRGALTSSVRTIPANDRAQVRTRLKR
jgi:hypothetical protein